MIEYFIVSLLPNLFLISIFLYIWFVRKNSKYREELLSKFKNDRARHLYQKIFTDKTIFLLEAIIAITAVLDAIFDVYEVFYEPQAILIAINTILELTAFGIMVYLVISLLKFYKSLRP